MQGFRCCHASRVHRTSRNVYIRRCRTDRHNGRSDKAILRQRARGSCSLSLVVNRYSSSFSSIFLSLSSFRLSWSSPLSKGLQVEIFCLLHRSYLLFLRLIRYLAVCSHLVVRNFGGKLGKGELNYLGRLGISFGISHSIEFSLRIYSLLIHWFIVNEFVFEKIFLLFLFF